MIAGIEGILEAYGVDYIIVKVGSISFQVYVPSPASTGSIGERVKLHTSLQLKESFIGVYGFATTEELELFEMVICISGIGPKAARPMRLPEMPRNSRHLPVATPEQARGARAPK